MSNGNVKFTEATGLNEGLDLARACAEFYVLERLEAWGNATAAHHLKMLESYLSQQFATYFEYAVATEIGCLTGEEMSECYEDHCDYCEECENEGCYADHCNCDCYDSTHEGIPPEVHTFLQNLQKAGKAASYSYSSYRVNTWKAWQDAARGDSTRLLDKATDTFLQPIWSPSFGGKPWATISGLVRDFRRGVVKPRTFVDRCWSLEHNGGCAFNKINYNNLERLMNVLIKQANDDYDYLLTLVRSEFKKLWMMGKYDPRVERDPIWLGVEVETYYAD